VADSKREPPSPRIHVAAADGCSCVRCGAAIALSVGTYRHGERVMVMYAEAPGGSWPTTLRPNCTATSRASRGRMASP
jgi:hypothetical protein